MADEWRQEEAEVDTIDWNGHPLHLMGVPAERNLKTKAVRFDPQVVARAAMREIARELGVQEERDLPLFLMLGAKPGNFKAGVCYNKYSLNKMLFYQWKRLEADGLGEAYAHDEFRAARAGPIPITLEADLRRLQAAGMLRIDWSTAPTTPTRVELTEAGERLAVKLWRGSPPSFREATQSVKEEIFPMSPVDLKNKVHADFPEYQKFYVDEDSG